MKLDQYEGKELSKRSRSRSIRCLTPSDVTRLCLTTSDLPAVLQAPREVETKLPVAAVKLIRDCVPDVGFDECVDKLGTLLWQFRERKAADDQRQHFRYQLSIAEETISMIEELERRLNLLPRTIREFMDTHARSKNYPSWHSLQGKVVKSMVEATKTLRIAEIVLREAMQQAKSQDLAAAVMEQKLLPRAVLSMSANDIKAQKQVEVAVGKATRPAGRKSLAVRDGFVSDVLDVFMTQVREGPNTGKKGMNKPSKTVLVAAKDFFKECNIPVPPNTKDFRDYVTSIRRINTSKNSS